MAVKNTCAHCHFFVRHYHGDHGVELTLAIEAEQRKKAMLGDLSWQRDSESLACSRGIWDEGLGINDSAKIAAISNQERCNKCYYFDYQAGMLLPAAEKLQQEKSTAESDRLKYRLTIYGLLIAIAGLIAKIAVGA